MNPPSPAGARTETPAPHAASTQAGAPAWDTGRGGLGAEQSALPLGWWRDHKGTFLAQPPGGSGGRGGALALQVSERRDQWIHARPVTPGFVHHTLWLLLTRGHFFH